jgi:hypothetical protein
LGEIFNRVQRGTTAMTSISTSMPSSAKAGTGTAAQAIGRRPWLLVLAALLRALARATPPVATRPAAQTDVAEDDTDRGALAAQPEASAPYPDWRLDVMTRGGSPVR